MPGSAGLVQGLLAQSGSLAAQPLAEAVLLNTRRIARMCNCSEADRERRGFGSVRACLEATDAAGIIQAQGVVCANPNVCLVATKWAPVIDGIALPGPPARLLAAGRINAPLSVALGANTNDTNLFVSGITAAIKIPVPAAAYELVVRVVTRKHPELHKQLLALYPPHAHQPFRNESDRIGWLLSDRSLCATRRLAAGFARARAATYAYRHDHFFTSNRVCTAVPNYHAPSLGAMHQDELSFVFGQPIFMDLGGVLPNCSVVGGPSYDPSCRECVFDAHELGYAHAVGRLWTNFAASGDPNRRHVSGQHAEAGDMEWPVIDPKATAAKVRNVLLRPDSLAAAAGSPQRMHSEAAMGRAKSCALWDMIDAEDAEMDVAADEDEEGDAGAYMWMLSGEGVANAAEVRMLMMDREITDLA